MYNGWLPHGHPLDNFHGFWSLKLQTPDWTMGDRPFWIYTHVYMLTNPTSALFKRVQGEILLFPGGGGKLAILVLHNMCTAPNNGNTSIPVFILYIRLILQFHWSVSTLDEAIQHVISLSFSIPFLWDSIPLFRFLYSYCGRDYRSEGASVFHTNAYRNQVWHTYFKLIFTLNLISVGKKWASVDSIRVWILNESLMGYESPSLDLCHLYSALIYELIIILYLNRISRADWLPAAWHEPIFLLGEAKKSYPKYRINMLLDSGLKNMKITDLRISYHVRPSGQVLVFVTFIQPESNDLFINVRSLSSQTFHFMGMFDWDEDLLPLIQSPGGT